MQPKGPQAHTWLLLRAALGAGLPWEPVRWTPHSAYTIGISGVIASGRKVYVTFLAYVMLQLKVCLLTSTSP